MPVLYLKASGHPALRLCDPLLPCVTAYDASRLDWQSPNGFQFDDDDFPLFVEAFDEIQPLYVDAPTVSPPIMGGGSSGESAYDRELRYTKERKQREKLDRDFQAEVKRTIHGDEELSRGANPLETAVTPPPLELDRAGKPWLESQIAELKASQQAAIDREILAAQQAQLLTLNIIEMQRQTDEQNELIILLSI